MRQDRDDILIARDHPGVEVGVPVNRIFRSQALVKRVGIGQHLGIEQVIKAQRHIRRACGNWRRLRWHESSLAPQAVGPEFNLAISSASAATVGALNSCRSVSFTPKVSYQCYFAKTWSSHRVWVKSRADVLSPRVAHRAICELGHLGECQARPPIRCCLTPLP